MHRIDTPTAQKDKFGKGKNGFTRGNPQTGTLATKMDSLYFDAIQEEIANAIESVGITLNKEKHDQLKLAIQQHIKNGQIKLSSSTNSKLETEAATSLAVKTVSDNAVKKSGDTMTGNLTINNSDSSAVLLKNNKNDEWMLRIHADGSFSIFNNKDGKWVSKFRNESATNIWRFENTSDVTISGKSVLKTGDGGLLSYTQTIKDVFAPEITTGFYRWDGNSVNTPYKGLGYFNKISWNANESTVLAHGYNTNRLFIGYKHKSTGDVKYDEILKAGDYGVGAPTGIPIQNIEEHLNTGFYGTNTAKIPNSPFTGGSSASSLLVLPTESPHWKVEQLSVVNGRIPRIYYRTDTKNDGKQTWYESITTANVGNYTHQFLGDLANKSLNDLTGTVAGNYFQGRNILATSENGYPINQAGTLTVMKNGADGAGCCQIYTAYRSARQFIRNYRGGSKTWEPWVEQITTANINDYLPVGIPQPWPTTTPPAGWLKCNGWRFDKNKYPKLAKAYPSGYLPEIRGETIRGWDDGRGVDPGRQILSWQGDAIRNIQGRFPTVYRATNPPPIGCEGVFRTDSFWNAAVKRGHSDDWGAIFSLDASRVVPTAHENRVRSIAFLYIVKAE